MAKILVVDDDAAVRDVLTSFFEKEGHEVLQAASVAEAWDALDQEPQAIFADVDMPAETGVDLVFRLRQHPAHADLPVAFVTAYAARSSPLQQSGRGAQLVIAKPFRRETVLQALNQLLGDVTLITRRAS